jgi:hypothetical protein
MLMGSPVMSGWFDHNRGACRQLTDTESIVTVDSAPLLCDVTASPARTVGLRFTVAVEPAMMVHVTPSGEVKALNVLPARGISFNDPPTTQAYGIDTSFRDPSGNNIRLTQVLEFDPSRR